MSGVDDIKYALDLACSEELDFIPIGDGSNIVLVGDLPSVVVRVNLRGRSIKGDLITVAAGESWHRTVEWALSKKLYGLENLALIPGTVGAAPIQNIGAYGVELGEFVECVSVIDTKTFKESWMPASDCCFGYRQSCFQKEKNLLVTGLSLRLKPNPEPRLDYPELKNRLSAENLTPTPINIFQAVCMIRSEKLPDPYKIPNVGSFFKNPLVSVEQAFDLRSRLKGLPIYQTESDAPSVKLSAAWLIDQAGLKRTRIGSFEVSDQHALVIVNRGGGRTADLLKLIEHIRTGVYSRFGVELDPEPGFFPTN